MGGVRFEPVLPVWLIAIGLVLGALALWRSLNISAQKPGRRQHETGVYSGGRFRGRGWVGVLRSVVLLALGWVMLGPVKPVQDVVTQAPQRLSDRLNVLVDRSGSMAIEDARVLGAEVESRSAAAGRYLSSGVLEALGQRYKVEINGFDRGLLGRVSAAELTEGLRADGGETDLAKALMESLVDTEAGDAVWVLSDGRATTDGDPAFRQAELALVASQAEAAGVPIHVLALGQPDFQPNRAVYARTQRQTFYAGETVRLEAVVYQWDGGEAPAKEALPVRVQVTDVDGGLIVAAADQVLTSGEVRYSFELPASWVGEAPGLRRVWVSAEALDGESHLKDNRQAVFFEVAEAPARVLVLEGSPSWQMRFWVDALRSDDRVAVTRVTELAEGRPLVTHPEGLPRPVPDPTQMLGQVDGFAAFDLVVLGQRAEALLSAAEFAAMRQWVDRYDGLIVIASPIEAGLHAGLGGLSPLVSAQDWSLAAPGRVAMSPGGLLHPVLGPWAKSFPMALLPPMISAPAEVKAGAAVLAEVGEDPLFVSMLYGGGKVTAALTTDLWRWWLAVGQAGLAGGGLSDNNINRDNGAAGDNTQQLASSGGSGGGLPFGDWVRGELLDEAPVGERFKLAVRPWQRRLGESFEVILSAREADERLWDYSVTAVLEGREAEPETILLHPVKGSQLRRAGAWVPQAAGVYLIEASLPEDLSGDQEASTQTATTERPAAISSSLLLPGVVTKMDREGLWTGADVEGLWALAAATGGQVVDAKDWRPFVEEVLLVQEAADLSPVFETDWVPAWDTGSLLTMMVLLLGAEWLLRRRAGLI